MPTVGIDGHRFQYDERGSGPPLVLVHGTGGSTESLAAASELLATGLRVISYDRRGFARTAASPVRSKDYLRRHADDLAGLVRELGAVPATLVGWSWGAIAALATAIHHPSVVRQLVLFEPPFHMKKKLSLGTARAVGGAIVLGRLRMHRRGAIRFGRWALRRKDGSSAFDDLDPAVRDGLLANPRSMIAELEAGTGEDLTDAELASVKCPVSFILGDNSGSHFSDALARLAKSFPDARTVRMPGGDHMSIVLEPELFATAVRDAIA